MNRIDLLLANYRRHIQLPLRAGLPTSQRIWFAVYPPEDERRLSHRILEFELATKEANHEWRRIDLRGQFARWLNTIDEAERAEWWRNPDDIELYAKTDWKAALSDFFKKEISAAPTPEPELTVFALTGLPELYDFLHVSEFIEAVERSFPGFLLVFFPGDKEGNTYRFLNARAGWNYLAVPILSEK